MMPKRISDLDAATALANVLGETAWEAVGLAKGYLVLAAGASVDAAARITAQHSGLTLRRSGALLVQAQKEGLHSVLTRRERTGSAENPVTKLFPARVTEQRFVELVDDLCTKRAGLTYRDERDAGSGLADFTLHEAGLELPINVKNAGTRFERAAELVGLDPDDSIPIPAYKANLALESSPNLIYVVAVDYELTPTLNSFLPTVFGSEETIVWSLLNEFAGARVRSAEDAFVNRVVHSHWDRIKSGVASVPFRVVSARKAIRILNTIPKRTPGIGLRAWGTGASAETNVHLSVREDTKPWDEISERIVTKGVDDIVQAVNRKRQEWVYDPEI